MKVEIKNNLVLIKTDNAQPVLLLKPQDAEQLFSDLKEIIPKLRTAKSQTMEFQASLTLTTDPYNPWKPNTQL